MLNIHRGPRLLVEALCAVLTFTHQDSQEVRAHPAFAILTYSKDDPFVVTVEAVSWRRLQLCWHLDRQLFSQLLATRASQASKQLSIRNPNEPNGPALILDAGQLAGFLANAGDGAALAEAAAEEEALTPAP